MSSNIKKGFLVDFIFQTLIVGALVIFEILGRIGMANGSALGEYFILSMILTAPVSGMQGTSALIWAFVARTKFHIFYLPLATLLAGTIAYFVFGGQHIPTAIFWGALLFAKIMSIFYWAMTFVYWRKA